MAQANATKVFAQACSYCHSRKIKCIPTGKSSCQTCEDNSIKCRLRRPKKLGRPRGASQPSFPFPKQSLINYKSLPSRRGDETSPNADSSCSSNRASALHSPDATRTEVGDSLSLLFPSSTTQLQQSPKMLSTAKPSHWSNTVSETINNPPYTQPFFDTSGKTPLTKEVSAVSEADISMMNLSFDDLFVDIQVNDGSLARTSLPSFPSLFNSYLEAHEALTFIRSGSYELPIGDLKHDRGAMGLVTKINELGARAVNSPFPGSNDQCCLQLAFLAVVKGCELAEQISIMVLPSTRTPLHSSCMDFSTMKPPYGSRHDASPMDNDPWITGPLAQSDHSKPSAEHITALVRLDVQLSKLNSLLSKFIQSTPEHMPLADVLAARCRRRLSYLHTQIRGVVDSMIPAWD